VYAKEIEVRWIEIRRSFQRTAYSLQLIADSLDRIKKDRSKKIELRSKNGDRREKKELRMNFDGLTECVLVC